MLGKILEQAQSKTAVLLSASKAIVNESDKTWYENKPLGINKLGKMMREISVGAGLSKTYTNHCVRATAITIWSNAEVPARHIMSISGHVNEQSIGSYNQRPSVQQLKKCSSILSEALVESSAPESTASSTFLTTATSTTGSLTIPSGLFNGCTISNANVSIVLPKSQKTFFYNSFKANKS